MVTRIVLALLLVITTGVGIRLALCRPPPPNKTAAVGRNYDTYRYGRSEEAKILDFGTQPFGTPATFIAECLFHDRVLQRQLAGEGWKMREHGYRSGKEMLPYADGRLDVMILGDIPSLIAVQQQRVGIFAVCSQGYNAVIAKRWLLPSELKGRRVGYTAGTAAHYALERTLESARLSLENIISVPLHPEEMAAALSSNQVEAVAVWEPFVAAILLQVPGSTVMSSSDTYTFITIDLDFAARHPAVLKPFLAAIIRATRWGRLDMKNLRTNLLWDRQAAVRFAGQASIEVSPKWISRLREDTIDNPSFPMLPLNFSDPQSLLCQQFEFLKNIGSLPAGAEWKTLCERVNTRCLPEVIRESQAWQIDCFDYAPDKLYLDEEGKP